MAIVLDPEDLCSEAFEMYYACLTALHGIAYADYILGYPQEFVIAALEEDILLESYQNQTCAICKSAIPDDSKEECSFEKISAPYLNPSLEDSPSFFLCPHCQ